MLKKLMQVSLILAITVLLFFLWILPAVRFQRGLEKRLSASSEKTFARREILIPEAGLNIHVYSRTKEPDSTLILLPGLHPQGIHDSRFSAFAETCADAGFQVIAPDITEFRNFQVRPEIVEQLTRLIVALPLHVPERSPRRLGVLGISYAAGPAFLASARPEVKNKLDFLVSVGGYYNLADATEFSLTGHYRNAASRNPHQWGRLIFALHNLEKLGPKADLQILRESLQLRLSLKDREAAQKETSLSPEGKAFLQEVLQGLSKDKAARFIRVLHEYDELLLRLSPESIVRNLDSQIRIYLLHGRTDDLIPFEETIRLEDALRRQHHPEVRSLITASLTHVDVKSSGDLWGAVRLFFWIRAWLAEA